MDINHPLPSFDNTTKASTENLRNQSYSKLLSQGASSKNQKLLNLAARKPKDTLQLTQYLLKKRLSEGLDNLLKEQFQENPQLKNNVHIGILTDANLQVEVIPLETAISSVVDIPKEDAAAFLKNNPVGYYTQEQFSLQTPDEAHLKKFKKNLQDYFKKNQGILDYLRQNPEANVKIEDLYKTPKL